MVYELVDEMKRLIYQVYVGPPTKLYDFCTQSVVRYCAKHGIDYHCQIKPILKIRPNVFSSNRSHNAVERLGYLPIYEKENAFDRLGEYDQVAIIDSDIFIKDNAPNIFDDLEPEYAFGGVVEREMPLTPAYRHKIINYSKMQYSMFRKKLDFKWDSSGAEFMNMGVMVMNKSIMEHLHGQTARQFLDRNEFQDFIDGKGAWKWSTDQTLLNYWIKNERMNVKNMDWRWNGLYTAIPPEATQESYFVHLFLKDKLPNKGENVELLVKNFYD